MGLSFTRFLQGSRGASGGSRGASGAGSFLAEWVLFLGKAPCGLFGLALSFLATGSLGTVTLAATLGILYPVKLLFVSSCNGVGSKGVSVAGVPMACTNGGRTGDRVTVGSG